MKWLLEKLGTAEIRNILAVISVLGAFVILILIIMKPIPNGNAATVNLSLGIVLGGLVGGVAGYYFGASKDDKPKL